jgi:hypothetical protein
VKLGQHLERELGIAGSNNTLARWMAHRIAELMHRAETVRKHADREAARRECADLILRLWEKRCHLPAGAPLAPFADFLENFLKESDAWHWQTEIEDKSRTWAQALPELRILLDREMHAWREAALAAQPRGKAREVLRELGDLLEPEEARTLRGLAESTTPAEILRRAMFGDPPGTPPAPRTKAERAKVLRDKIAALTRQRMLLLETVLNRKAGNGCAKKRLNRAHH